MKKLFFSLDSDYRENAKWIMNDKTALYLQNLKDGQGNFFWNQYDGTFMGKEILISNYMPDIDAGKKPVAFGDFSNYWIIERQNPTIKRLSEMFILKQHQGFIMREYLDAKLIDKDSVLTLAIEG
ncbi:HK97 family phage major capsid protein [Peptoniphilus ivorii]|nr:HK97 family phage major capsid protein [Peptoniphilus ivorii]